MNGNSEDTIFALSSGLPPAGIAVVRISGPRARFALETMLGRVPEPRQARLVQVRDPGTRDIIDAALALWFPAPHSETGEDVAELQLHGGRAVVAAVLAALGTLEGLRLAEPGEFTRRAFANGRLDLTEVEGLADLIYAETEAQRRQAYRQLRGALKDQAESWRGRLIEALALVEARIDFSDEADVPGELVAPALAIAKALREEILAALADERRGERLRDGFVIAIAGPPNAGKSSLLNRIARREAAIVTPIPGTTRDVIEVHLNLEGLPVTLVDTAGIRPAGDPIEQEGVRRARERAATADLVLWVFDAAEGGGPDAGVTRDGGPMVWRVANKTDLLDSDAQQCRARNALPDVGRISAKTGAGLQALLTRIVDHVRATLRPADAVLITRERHRAALKDAAGALGRALGAPPVQEEIIAEELRLAARALARLTGQIDVEDVLDVIFRDFCIGK